MNSPEWWNQNNNEYIWYVYILWNENALEKENKKVIK